MRRTLACLIAACTLSLATPLAAQAASVRVVDPKDDVRQSAYDEESQTSVDEPVPDASPDVRRTTITHTRHRISIRLTFDDLDRPVGDEITGVELELVGPQDSQTRRISLLSSSEGTEAEMARGGVAADESTVCTKALVSRLRFRDDVASVSFPRRCAGNPSKVRVSGGGVTYGDAESERPFSLTYDDLTGRSASVGEFGTRFSPWAERG